MMSLPSSNSLYGLIDALNSYFKIMTMTIWHITNISVPFHTVVVSTPFAIKLSASCAAMLVTKIEAKGGRMET